LQGSDIYPEGLLTGNFGNLTKSAVARFQEKYKNEVLLPLGLSEGTGFAGVLTRQKINQLLNGK
jgi:peptidoglycan hydrolase-like protein with peptidoglycan-binding domain